MDPPQCPSHVFLWIPGYASWDGESGMEKEMEARLMEASLYKMSSFVTQLTE